MGGWVGGWVRASVSVSVSVSFNSNSAFFQLYHCEEMMMRSALYWTNTLSWIFFYSVSSLKQQSTYRHVSPLAHIILIPRQPDFALSPQCCVLSGEAKNTKFIVFGLTRSWLEPTIYRTRGELANHYTTDPVI